MQCARSSLLVVPFLVAAVGCTPAPTTAPSADAGPRDAFVPDAWVMPVPATTIAAANAVTAEHPSYPGQQRFLWDTFGAEQFERWPPADWLVALQSREPDVFGDQFSAFGLVPDPDDDLPVGLKRGLADPTRVHDTCALCHVARLPDGSLWLGAPNTALDLMRFRAELDERWVADGHPSLLSEEERERASAYGPGRVGVEPPGAPFIIPSDLPPYWLLGASTGLNYLGSSGNLRSEVYLRVYATGVGDPTRGTVPFPEEARIEPLVDYIAALRPPVPPLQDPDVAETGRAIFERELCGNCHHMAMISLNSVTRHDPTGVGPEQVAGESFEFLHGLIRTEGNHRWLVADVLDAGTPQTSAMYDFVLEQSLYVRGSDGYREDDLHGLWASAPYLHNGSVPTLDALFLPEDERPTSFARGTFELDTTQPGNGNVGHEWGTDLPAEERAALVTYLLSQ